MNRISRRAVAGALAATLGFGVAAHDSPSVSQAQAVGGTSERLASARAEYASDPRLNCSAYPGEKRIFLETQGWWMDPDTVKFPSSIPSNQQPLPGPGGTKIGGHTHTGTCFPQGQDVTKGRLRFDVRLMLHKGDFGKVNWLDIGLGPNGKSLSKVTFNKPLSCAATRDDIDQNCTYWVPIELDTSKVPAGYQELRFRFNVQQPNGERQFASTGWQAYYHGNHTTAYRKAPWLEARGWYDGTKYANSRFLSELPDGPVKGTWTFNAQMVPGSGGTPIVQSGVFVDAFFNANDFGTIIRESQGESRGRVSIDTTRLSNGLHFLGILAANRANNGINTGVLTIPFIVEN